MDITIMLVHNKKAQTRLIKNKFALFFHR